MDTHPTPAELAARVDQLTDHTWDRTTLRGPLTWRDLVVADQLRWTARVAEARAGAVTAATNDAGPASEATEAEPAAALPWETAQAAGEDFALFVADRTLDSGQALDDWPALIVDEADDRFYQARGYDLHELITDAQPPPDADTASDTASDTAEGDGAGAWWQARDQEEGDQARRYWADVAAAQAAERMTPAKAEDAAVMAGYDLMFEPPTADAADGDFDVAGW